MCILEPQYTKPLPFALYTTSMTPAGINYNGKMKNPALRELIKDSAKSNEDTRRRLCDLVNHVRSAKLQGILKKKELKGIGASNNEEAIFLILLTFLTLDDNAVAK